MIDMGKTLKGKGRANKDEDPQGGRRACMILPLTHNIPTLAIQDKWALE